MATLSELPTELILQICTSLCLHCQIPRVVDASPDVVSAASPGQTALSRLSQTCKRFQRLSQPILFHWYHARHGDGYHEQRKRLAPFLFATLRRPDLNAAVQAISLYEPEYPFGDRGDYPIMPRSWHVAQAVLDSDGLLRRAAQRLGGHLLRKTSSDRPTLEDFNDTAIATAPNLAQLCLQRGCEWGRTDEWCWTGWPYPLPSLTCLVLRGADGDPRYRETYHLYQARSLIRQAPNLQVLIAPDCAAGAEHAMAARFRKQPWGVPLDALRRLSLNGLRTSLLATILARCLVLEDLEFFDDGLQVTPDMLRPENHLGHVKATLRRLCYSLRGAGTKRPAYCGGEEEEAGGGQDRDELDDVDVAAIIEYPGYLGRPDGEPTLGLSFASFPVLEVLELEQLVLYGPCLRAADDDSETIEDRGPPYAFTMPEDLLARLPPSIRRLRIGGVFQWAMVYRDLLALADQACSRFSSLTTVALEVFKVPPQDEARLLTETLRDTAGIMVSISRVARGPLERGLLPVRPGQPGRDLETVVWE